MYELEYLPAARRDMVEIVRYISRDLQNPAAAERLAGELVAAGEGLREFPYAHPAYVPIKPLHREYRRTMAGNYFLFYWVEEGQKKITIARVIYAKRDISRLLD